MLYDYYIYNNLSLRFKNDDMIVVIVWQGVQVAAPKPAPANTQRFRNRVVQIISLEEVKR